MKKILSITLAIMLMIMAVPYVTFAADYEAVEWTTIELGTPYTTAVSATDPYINCVGWSGYAKGFSVALEASKAYRITVESSDPNAAYIDRLTAVLNGSLSGDLDDDFLAISSNASGNVTYVSNVFDFAPTKSGNYKILTWGWNVDRDDDYGVQIYGGQVKITVEKQPDYSKDIACAQDFIDALDDIALGDYGDICLNFVDDVDMSGIDFYPIELERCITVKGNNHTITGLENPLFGGLKHLNASDLTIDFNYKSTSGEGCIAALCRYVESCDVNNCHVSGSIDISGNTYDIYCVSGLISDIEDGPSTIKDCSTDVDISIDASEIYAGCGVYDIGGLVGYVEYDTLFSGCSAEGSITINNLKNHAGYIGGFAGYFEDREVCDNCSADVDITINTTGDLAQAGYTGGFTGYIDEACVFSNCWSAGSINIEGKHNGCEYIGGFNGYSHCCGNTHCYNCYSITDIKGGSEYVGSFFGSAYENDTFKNCYAAGDVTFMNYDGTEGGTYNGLFIGGTYYSDYEVNIENCFVKKDMSGEDAPKIIDFDDTDLDSIDITEVDFSDSDAVANMTKALNDKRDSIVDEVNEFLGENSEFDYTIRLFAWGKTNEKNGPIFANRTVRFLDENGNEILVLNNLNDGDNFSSLAPAVPAKEGYTGKWDTNFIVDGDMDVYAVYEKDSNNSDPGSKDPGNNNNNNNNKNKEKDVPTSPETGNSDIILMVLSVLLVVNMGLIVKVRANKVK